MENKDAEEMVGVRRLKLAAEVALDQGRDSHAYKFLRDALCMLGNGYETPDAVDDTRLGALAAQDLHQRGRVREAALWLMTVLGTRLRLLGSPIRGEVDVLVAGPGAGTCRHCGRAFLQGKRFCAWCGASLG